jgi:ferredoxin
VVHALAGETGVLGAVVKDTGSGELVELDVNPRECIDCGACEPVCPVTAISSDLRVGADKVPWRDDNAAFFDLTLPGRDEPLGSPGGAAGVGKLAADAPLSAVTPATADPE